RTAHSHRRQRVVPRGLPRRAWRRAAAVDRSGARRVGTRFALSEADPGRKTGNASEGSAHDHRQGRSARFGFLPQNFGGGGGGCEDGGLTGPITTPAGVASVIRFGSVTSITKPHKAAATNAARL